jgi:hypothetical protein
MTKVPGLGNVCDKCHIPADESPFGVLDNLTISNDNTQATEQEISEYCSGLARDGFKIREIKEAVSNRYNRNCNPNILADARGIIKQRNDAEIAERQKAKAQKEQQTKKEETPVTPVVEDVPPVEESKPNLDNVIEDMNDSVIETVTEIAEEGIPKPQTFGEQTLAPLPFPEEETTPEIVGTDVEQYLDEHEAPQMKCEELEVKKDEVYEPIKESSDSIVYDRPQDDPQYYGKLRVEYSNLVFEGYTSEAAILKIWQRELVHHGDPNKFLRELESVV